MWIPDGINSPFRDAGVNAASVDTCENFAQPPSNVSLHNFEAIFAD